MNSSDCYEEEVVVRCFIDGESRNFHPNSKRENVKTIQSVVSRLDPE